jgi:nicotinate-nucleotide adenylyltransferase
MKRVKRIGIYSGTFDPVHAGHIAFALQAIKAAQLDEVVFLPERSPRNKHASEHYAHRLAMLKRAIKPYPNMSVLELADKNFNVKRTLPQLQNICNGADLIMLAGSDVLAHMPDWPNIDALLQNCELVIGARAKDEPAMIRTLVSAWPRQPRRLHIVQSYAPHVSSTRVRGALAQRKHTSGLLSSVHTYARANWLYVSIEHAINKKVN